MTARTLVRAWQVVGALLAALVLCVAGALLTHWALFGVLGPLTLFLIFVAVPVALVMTVVRAVSMSAQRRAREHDLLDRFHGGV